ncbi:MAG: sec-independent protein translocase protein TatC [Actinomycetota bacterium]|jgi:sec-independent protein translocase protein TatC|nr:sec-independent protein translocase protein TatC [Actinomycetota bacterium]
MTVVEHLTELRRRLMIAIGAVALCAIVGFVFYNPILAFLKHPYCQTLPSGRACSLYVQDPLEGFAIRLKVAGYTGLFLAFPVVLWQLWRFITPGLHPKEKRYAIPFIVCSIILFAFGAALAYVTFSKALQFLQSVGGPSFQQIYSPGKYLRLVLLMFLAFGLAFEFPVVLVFLELAGVLSTARLKQWRRPAVVVILVVAAVITPSQDPWTLMAMSIPMYIFYEASILIGRLLKK